VGLWESTDGGTSWEARVAGLEPNAIIHDILFDPTQPNLVYVADIASGMYRSMDGGQTWEKINKGLSMRAVTGMDISADGQHLYVGTQGGGVFRLDLNGQPPVSISPAAPGETPTPATAGTSAEPEARAASFGLYVGLGVGVVVLAVVAFVLARRRHG
jgi:photosystem II stability/assembly factor-like uncharacterized protein